MTDAAEYGISINALSDGGLGDRRTVAARIREYGVPILGLAGRARLYVPQHVIDAFRLHAMGVPPRHVVSVRFGHLWSFETNMINGAPIWLAEAEAWRDAETAKGGAGRDARAVLPDIAACDAPAGAPQSSTKKRGARRGGAREGGRPSTGRAADSGITPAADGGRPSSTSGEG